MFQSLIFCHWHLPFFLEIPAWNWCTCHPCRSGSPQRHIFIALLISPKVYRMPHIFLIGEYVGNCTAAPCVGVCGIVGKHPRPPACSSLRGKSRGFRTLSDTVLRQGQVRVWKNAMGRLPMAWKQEKGADICISTPFEPVSIWLFRLRTVFAP